MWKVMRPTSILSFKKFERENTNRIAYTTEPKEVWNLVMNGLITF